MSGTHTVISNKISMLFGSEISLKDFSFSQLIVAVKNLFDTEGVPGFVKALVILRYNRRTSKSRGLVFHKMIEAAVQSKPKPS